MNNQTSSPTTSVHSYIRSVIFASILACFSVYLALPSVIFAAVCLVLFLLCAYKISANKAIFVGIFAVCGALFFLMPITSLASSVSVVAVASAGSVMLYAGKKSSAAYIISTAAAYGIAFFVTGSPISALSVLFPLPAAIALAVCSKKKLPRVTAICAVSAAILVSAFVPFVYGLISEYGTDAGLIINQLRENFSGSFVEVFRTISNMAGVKLEDIMDVSALSSVAELAFPLIPAFAIAATNILAFFASFIHAVIRHSLGMAQEKNEAIFRLSSASAWIYILSIISFFIAFGDTRAALIATFVMGSLNIILTPAFALVGAAAFLSASRNKRGKKNLKLRIILIIAGVLYLGVLLIIPIAVNGAITTLKLNKINAPPTTKTKE